MLRRLFTRIFSLETLFSNQFTALLSPLAEYSQGISKPFPAPLFTLLPVILQLISLLSRPRNISAHVQPQFHLLSRLWHFYLPHFLARACIQGILLSLVPIFLGTHENHEHKIYRLTLFGPGFFPTLEDWEIYWTMSYELRVMSYISWVTVIFHELWVTFHELWVTFHELWVTFHELWVTFYELHSGVTFQTEGVNCRLQDADCRWGFMMRVADWGGGGGCRMQMQVAYKYGSFVYLGKVKKITNLGCSCPSSDLSFARFWSRVGCSERTYGKWYLGRINYVSS